MKIGAIEIGSGHPCRTICEIGNAHNGSKDRAIRLISAAHEAGADLIKFQCFLPDELVALRGDGPAPDPWGSEGWSMHDLYSRAQTPHDWFPDLVGHAHEVGIPWFSSVFGLQSLALLESLHCPAYKIAALDSENVGLSRWVAASGKPIIRSEPPQYSEDDVLSNHARRHELHMLCPPGYPQEHAQLDELGDWYTGYSYHGTSSETPALAAFAGAKLIECHFQLEDEPSELEADISLNESQFAGMIGRIRHFEGLL